MSIVAVIPARGGSKGLPNKNLLPLKGKELIAWSVDFALELDIFDEILVSSDSAKILATAKKYGASTVKRPAKLAQDNSTSADAVLHSLSMHADETTVVLLQPTTPFRRKDSFLKALNIFKDKNQPCVYVSKPDHSIFSTFTNKEGSLVPLFSLEKAQLRRQDHEVVYQLTGGLYITKLKWLREFKSFVSPAPRFVETFGVENIDIDSKNDLAYAEYISKTEGLLC